MMTDRIAAGLALLGFIIFVAGLSDASFVGLILGCVGLGVLSHNNCEEPPNAR